MKTNSIQLKLSYTYITIMISACICGAFCLYSLLQYSKLDDEMSQEILPCTETLRENIEISEHLDRLFTKAILLEEKKVINELKSELNLEFKSIENSLNHCIQKTEIDLIHTLEKTIK